MRKERLYLDYNATAPLLSEARGAMVDAMATYANPSSVHQDGRAARALIENARREVARLVHADPSHVVFTSGATEAANHVLTPHFTMGRSPIRISRLYLSAIEHPCVLGGGRFDADAVAEIPVDGEGLVDCTRLETALAAHDRQAGLAMVAVMLANNESGVIQPIRRIADIVHAAGGLLVVDAVQAVTRMPVDIEALGADFLILSAHKIGGPKGIGALVSRGETMMPLALVSGGGQEKGHRAGTENLMGIVGFGAAAHIGISRLSTEPERQRKLKTLLEDGMRAVVADIDIVSGRADRLPNTSFAVIPGLKAETAQIGFDLEGVSVSSGSACASGKVGESHVLAAMGRNARQGAIRISLGAETVESDIDRFLAAFEKVTARRSAVAA